MEKQQFESLKSSAKFVGKGNSYETGLHQFLSEQGGNLSKNELLTIALELCYASHTYMEPSAHNRFNDAVLKELEDRLIED